MNPRIPFACDMSALSAAQRFEHVAATKALFSVVQEIRPVVRGYRFILPSDALTLGGIATFMSLERLCCPFFNFNVELAGGSDSVALEVTGPDGVEPFIEAEFSAALREDIRFPAPGAPTLS